MTFKKDKVIKKVEEVPKVEIKKGSGPRSRPLPGPKKPTV